jgi:hypothetical protein
MVHNKSFATIFENRCQFEIGLEKSIAFCRFGWGPWGHDTLKYKWPILFFFFTMALDISLFVFITTFSSNHTILFVHATAIQQFMQLTQIILITSLNPLSSDKSIWPLTSDNSFTCKSFYSFALYSPTAKLHYIMYGR